MAQIFPPVTNTLARASIFGGLFIIAGALWVLAKVERSPYMTEVNVVREQPVPFSHQRHAAQLGIDCRYCHTGVEDSSFAGLPPTKTCMTCHSQIWMQAALLEPVRESFRTDRSLEWTRVHDLPDFAFFDHSIHVRKGVGCETCHGRVDQMPLMWQVQSLQMEWCLECHRHPEAFLRPREEVFTFGYEPTKDQVELGARLVEEYGIASAKPLTNCSICHR